MRRQNLDRDRTLQPSISRAIDLAHAARAQRGDDFIRPEFRARGEGHRSAVDYIVSVDM
jgi:hypothetical protein